MCNARIVRSIVVLSLPVLLFAAASAQAGLGGAGYVRPRASALDANTGVTDNGTTLTWADQSGSGYSATGTGAGRPTLLSSSIAMNGNAAIDLTGTGANNYLNLTTGVAVVPSTSFFVYNSLAVRTSTGGGLTTDQTNFNNFQLCRSGDPGYAAAGVFNSSPVAFAGTHVAGVMVTSNNDSTYAQYKAGYLLDDGNVSGLGAIAAPAANYYFLGQRQDGVQLNGLMSEVLIYNRTLGSVEWILTENHLSARYGTTMAANDKYAGDTPANGDYDFNVIGIGYASASDNVTSSPGHGHFNGLILASVLVRPWAIPAGRR